MCVQTQLICMPAQAQMSAYEASICMNPLEALAQLPGANAGMPVSGLGGIDCVLYCVKAQRICMHTQLIFMHAQAHMLHQACEENA